MVTTANLTQGNKSIRDKVGRIPDAAKVMSDEDYGNSMSFILKH